MVAKDHLYVASLAKAMKVMEAFDHPGNALTLTEVAKITQLNRSAVQRFLHTWQTLGYLSQNPNTKRFSLTCKILGAGYNFLKSSRLVEVATPLLFDLRERTRVSVYLSVMEGDHIIYLARFPQRFILLEATLPGRKVPAFCASGGRAMMSRMEPEQVNTLLSKPVFQPVTPHTLTDPDCIKKEIQTARKKGFAIACEELLAGEIAISAPVVDSAGKALASVDMAASIVQWPKERVEKELAPQLMETVRMISSVQF